MLVVEEARQAVSKQPPEVSRQDFVLPQPPGGVHVPVVEEARQRRLETPGDPATPPLVEEARQRRARPLVEEAPPAPCRNSSRRFRDRTSSFLNHREVCTCRWLRRRASAVSKQPPRAGFETGLRPSSTSGRPPCRWLRRRASAVSKPPVEQTRPSQPPEAACRWLRRRASAVSKQPPEVSRQDFVLPQPPGGVHVPVVEEARQRRLETPGDPARRRCRWLRRRASAVSKPPATQPPGLLGTPVENGGSGPGQCRWSPLAWTPMSHPTSTPRHPLLACADTIEKALAAVLDCDPAYLAPDDKAELLLRLTRLLSQQEALRLRTVAAAGDLAADHGRRTVADWLAPRTHTDRRAAHAQEKLAHALDTTLAPGRCRGGRRPDAPRPGPGHRQGPRRAAGRGRRRGHPAGRAAPGRGRRRLRTRRAGPVRPPGPGRGRPRGRRRAGAPRVGAGRTEGRVGDPAGLHAPRRRVHRHRRHRARRDGSPAADLPRGVHLPRRHDRHAATATQPATRPPASGCPPTGTAASRSAPSSNASTPPGCPTTAVWPPRDRHHPPGDPADRARAPRSSAPARPITAGHARRLACTAGLVPAVLGTRSEVLDLGRTARLFTPAQRKALALRHPRCRAEDCDVPAPWCEAHHATPWSRGGTTDLTDGVLLCHWHHQRAHDTRYTTDRRPPAATSATTEGRERRALGAVRDGR